MTMSDDALALRYLLGQLPPADEERFEERYLGEPLLYERLLAVETQLLDDFRENRLDPVRQRHFRYRYLASPRCRERARLVGELETLARRARPVRHLRAWGSAAALLAVGLLGSWMAIDRGGPPAVAVPEAVAPALAEKTLRLEAGRTRGGSGTDFPRPGPRPVRVDLELRRLPEPDATFTASLATAEGEEVWREEGLGWRREGARARVAPRVPGARLGVGDYVLTLSRATPGRPAVPADEYFFRVVP
jgi:hypothetical protein